MMPGVVAEHVREERAAADREARSILLNALAQQHIAPERKVDERDWTENEYEVHGILEEQADGGVKAAERDLARLQKESPQASFTELLAEYEKSRTPEGIQARLERIAKEASSGCGCWYELYQQNVNTAVDRWISSEPNPEFKKAITLEAERGYDYDPNPGGHWTPDIENSDLIWHPHSAFDRFPDLDWNDASGQLKQRASEIQTIVSDTGISISPKEAIREAAAEREDVIAESAKPIEAIREFAAAQTESYKRGYEHLEQRLSDHMNAIPGRQATPEKTVADAMNLARQSNMHLHGRHPETSIYKDKDFRKGSMDAVRNFVSDVRDYAAQVPKQRGRTHGRQREQ
jgi:hypothetical protein